MKKLVKYNDRVFICDVKTVYRRHNYDNYVRKKET